MFKFAIVLVLATLQFGTARADLNSGCNQKDIRCLENEKRGGGGWNGNGGGWNGNGGGWNGNGGGWNNRPVPPP
jgi:hypothetical protein